MTGRVTGMGEGAANWLGCEVEDTLGRGIDVCIELRDQASWSVVLHRAVRSRCPISLNVAPTGRSEATQRTARLLPLRTSEGRLNGFTLLVESAEVATATVEPAAASSQRTPLDRASDRAGVLAAAHDLREPLRKMQHNARQLQAAEAPRLTDQGRRQLESLQSAADRMQGMIGGMLRLARIDTGNVEIERLEIGGLIDEVRADLAVLIEEHRATFDITSPGAVTGDAAQLRALFQNLIDNSIRYRRRDVAPRIRIAAAASEDAAGGIVIDYEDNARGIPLPELAFQPFRNREATDHGTGIGLSLCRRICRRHGGELTIADTGESGTTFVIELNDLEAEAALDA